MFSRVILLFQLIAPAPLLHALCWVGVGFEQCAGSMVPTPLGTSWTVTALLACAGRHAASQQCLFHLITVCPAACLCRPLLSTTALRVYSGRPLLWAEGLHPPLCVHSTESTLPLFCSRFACSVFGLTYSLLHTVKILHPWFGFAFGKDQPEC